MEIALGKGVRLVSFLFLVVALFFLIGLGNFFWSIRQFETIGPRLRKKITGDEVQAWAMAELNSRSTPSNDLVVIRRSELKNPLPEPIKEIWKSGPLIREFGRDAQKPSYVQLTWGSGFLGTYGIEIGPTNFTGRHGQIQWQPGIYYWLTR